MLMAFAQITPSAELLLSANRYVKSGQMTKTNNWEKTMNSKKGIKNYSNSIKKFNWNNIEDICVSQRDDWTCQLTALRIVLRYYNIDIYDEEIIYILKHENFKVFDFGTYLPFIGVIALKLGFNISYRTQIANLYPDESTIISSGATIRKIILEDIKNTSEEEPIIQGYYAFLKILDLDGKIYLHQPYSPPSFKEIKKALKKGPVISVVSGNEYYKIDEDWGHALVLIPTYDNRFIVLDDFRKKGYEEYPNWEMYLNHSKEYDWSTWKGSMIEFRKRNKIYNQK
ncbi:MAG: hypothetical protein CVT88_01180 [Candidatus Altiarchaeales archaeon HGW-Altiarchaeales-1]|nr:MAG: hypothetical protein CVT88_01180 [Candidatus Altiarchaeales archaeon HGW-Altiarchaeales-1]